MKRASGFVAALVFAWLVWDTGADPVRLARGLPWIFDFFLRMMPPDPSVLPAALLGALKTVEIALLGTAVAAVLALPLGFVSARNVAPGAVFYPARAVLNFFRSVDTLVYALVFVAAVGLGPFPGVLAVVAYTTRPSRSSTPRRSRVSIRGLSTRSPRRGRPGFRCCASA